MFGDKVNVLVEIMAMNDCITAQNIAMKMKDNSAESMKLLPLR